MKPELKPIKNRVFGLSLAIYLLFILIGGKLWYVSLVEGEHWRTLSAERTIERRTIEARRGDIYSADGKPLATTKPIYTVHFDPMTVNDTLFDHQVGALSSGLSKLLPSGRSAAQWERHLREQRTKGRRYVLLAKDLNYSEKEALAALPILRRGQLAGGFIEEESHERIQMATQMYLRSIGYITDGGSAGLEGYYDHYLRGQPGHRLSQKIGKDRYKPLVDKNALEPRDGYDLIATLDTRIQDVAQASLLRQLQRFEADHGSVVVMEVASGNVVAMANLGRNDRGVYTEDRNYAVWETTEPGSTFKLLSAMILLEQGYADTNTTVDTENGVFRVHDRLVRDSNGKGYGKVTLKEAFEKSSNTGIVKLVYQNFQTHPKDFVDFLYRIGLDQPTGVEIEGEGKPNIITPSDPRWSGTTLPWMAFGYNIALTPLQMLCVYNAVANDGKMVKPNMVASIVSHGRTIASFEPQVLNPAICSKTTIAKLKKMLEGAVANGTATNIHNPQLPVAGKTGTSQLNYWDRQEQGYQSSFAGYFPADQPKYSCIVTINKPNASKGYYGNIVAAPVFMDIAEEVYSQIPLAPTGLALDELDPLPNLSGITSVHEKALQSNYLPNLKGLSAREAAQLLEGEGINVQFEGAGMVVQQWPAVGTALHTIRTVKLVMG